MLTQAHSCLLIRDATEIDLGKTYATNLLKENHLLMILLRPKQSSGLILREREVSCVGAHQMKCTLFTPRELFAIQNGGAREEFCGIIFHRDRSNFGN